MGTEVTATGLYWLSSCGDRILSSGMTLLVFQMFGMMPVSTDSAQVYRKWVEMLSGPAVLPMLVLLNWHVTSFLDMIILG